MISAVTSTNPKRPIPTSDRDTIRDIYIQAVLRGADSAELAICRQELIQASGYGEKQVRAVTAWITMEINRARSKWGETAKVLSDRQILGLLNDLKSEAASELIAEYWGLGNAADTKSIQVICDKWRGTGDIGLDHAPDCSSQEITQGEPEITMSSIKLPDLEQSDQFSNRSYVEANYDFAAKQEWRLKWRDFLARSFSETDLANAKVLCLPSIDPIREVQHYLTLGVRAENIFAVEGAKGDSQRLFLDRATRLGIHPVIGRLESVLPTLNERFSIVSLDFPGQYCGLYQTIVSLTPTANKAAILLNLMEGRESEAIQNTLRFDSLNSSDDGTELLLNKFRQTLGKDPDQVKAVIGDWVDEALAASSRIALSDAREDRALHSLMRGFGIARPELLTAFQHRYIESILAYGRHEAKWLGLFEDYSVGQMHGLLRGTDRINMLMPITQIDQLLAPYCVRPATESLKAIQLHSLYGCPYIIDTEVHEYVSEVSRSHRPFYSRFDLQVRPAEHEHLRWKGVVTFLRDVGLALWKDGFRKAEDQERHFLKLDFGSKPSPHGLTKTAAICSLMNQREVARLPVVKINEGTQEFAKWIREQKSSTSIV